MLLGLFSEPYVQPAECIIKVEGEEVSELYPFVSSVTVEASRSCFSEATITFISPVDENDHWQVADDERLLPWNSIEIIADFQTGTEEIMRGVILQGAPDFPVNAGETSVTIIARDQSALFDLGTRQRTWGEHPLGTSDTLILTELTSEAGIGIDPLSGPGHSGIIVKQRTSDIVFLKKRAELNGYELLFEEGNVYFGPLRIENESQPQILAYAGRRTNCRTFKPSNNGHQARRFTYAQRDATGDAGGDVTVEPNLPLMGSMPARSSSNNADNQHSRIDRRTTPNEDENQALALGMANEGDLSIRAEGELDGTLYGHVLKVGLPVEIDGVGDLYSGLYYVDTVTHHFDQTGYRQKFNVVRNALGRAGGGGLGDVLGAVR